MGATFYQQKMDARLRTYCVVALIATTLVVIWSSLLNSNGNKYTLTKYRDDHCKLNYAIALDLPGSEMCCDEHRHGTSFLCIALFDEVNKLFTNAIFAFLIPILPAITTTFLDIVCYFIYFRANYQLVTSVNSDDPNPKQNTGLFHYLRTKANVSRIVFYFLIIVMRVVSLTNMLHLKLV